MIYGIRFDLWYKICEYIVTNNCVVEQWSIHS